MALQFRDLVWPMEPETYQEVNSRHPVYVTEDGVTSYSHMSKRRRVISGTGVFFGASAFKYYKQLEELMLLTNAGNLVHPELGTRRCYFTKLQLEQEPRADYIRYSFEFMEADDDGEVPQ